MLITPILCLTALGLGGPPPSVAHEASSLLQAGDQNQASMSELRIQSAWYGAGSDVVDAAQALRQLIVTGTTQFQVMSHYFGDPAPNIHKKLVIRYTLRGVTDDVTVEEGANFDFTDLLIIPKPGGLRVISATYGPADVTLKVRKAVAQGAMSIPARSDWFGIGDPQLGVAKKLTVVLQLPDGTQKTCVGADGASLMLVSEPLVTVSRVANGSFDTTDVSAMLSQMTYVPAGPNVLDQSGVFTIAPGIMRPDQLHGGLRSDFMQHTESRNSMAMFINPVPGRQPVLLWSEKVKVQPNTAYKFTCYAADISDNDGGAAATLVLDADGVQSRPIGIEYTDNWYRFYLILRTGATQTATLKIWRDVLPAGADRGSMIALDDISFERGAS